jgi:hypothetical protein
MQCEKGEQIVDTCSNVTLAHGILHKIRYNADIFKESAQSGTKVFVCVARLPQYNPYQKLWM